MAEEQNDIELTGKQRRFCEEYILDFNATRSAKVAGYSEDTAGQMGYENLRKPEIKAEIKRLQDNLAETLGISKAMVLKEHRKMAFSSIAHLHDTWVTRKEFEDLSDDQKACIQEISTKVTTEKDSFGIPKQWEYVKLKLYDKQKSLESLSKMLGFNEPEKLDHTTQGEKITFGGIQIINEEVRPPAE